MLSKNVLVSVKELEAVQQLIDAIASKKSCVTALERCGADPKKLATVLKKLSRLASIAMEEDKLAYGSHKPLKIKEVILAGNLDPASMTDVKTMLARAMADAHEKLVDCGISVTGDVFFRGADDNYYTIGVHLGVSKIDNPDTVNHWMVLAAAHTEDEENDGKRNPAVDVPGVVQETNPGTGETVLPATGEDTGRGLGFTENAVPEGTGADSEVVPNVGDPAVAQDAGSAERPAHA